MLRKVREESALSHEPRRSVPSAKAAVEESGRHICFAAMQEPTQDTWYLDSGASEHMTGNAANLDWNDKVEQQKVVLADGKVLFSKRKGTKNLYARDDKGSSVQIKLERVLVVEGLSVNLISVQAITRKGFEVRFNCNECWILKNGRTVVTGIRDGQFYRLASTNQ
ncbi:hypothetical protein RP20_CCG003494 [Aedes albopictus]|nr:hypothetical protein RP20_CCG003494 [Aedes albopictus]